MSKLTRYTRWAAADDNKRKARRARFRLESSGVYGIQEQEYVLTVDKEELTDPPVYKNSYRSKYRWRHQWESVDSQ